MRTVPRTVKFRPSTENFTSGARTVDRTVVAVPELEAGSGSAVTLELEAATGTLEELDFSAGSGVLLLLDFAPLELEAAPDLATTVMVPDFEAFLEAPVVVIVYLYAPGAADAETVPEI